MRVNLSDLLGKGLVEEFQSDKEQVQTEITNADKKLKSAKNMLGISEWGYAHAAAYNAMLHAGRALMFSKGIRPKGYDHHVAVVSFSHIYEKKYPLEILESFDQGRKRRHEFQYDDADAISESQAKNLIENTSKFVTKTKEILKM